MTNTTWHETKVQTDAAIRLLQQESAIVEATSLVCEVLRETGVNRAQLAELLGKTKGFVSQILGDDSNMTLRTLADVFTALRYEMRMYAEPLDGDEFGCHISTHPISRRDWRHIPVRIDGEVSEPVNMCAVPAFAT